MPKLKKPSKTSLRRNLDKAIAEKTDQLKALAYLHGRANAARATRSGRTALASPAAVWDETYRQLRSLYIADGCPSSKVTANAAMLGTPWLGYTQASHDDFIIREVIGWFGTTLYRTGNIGGPTVADHVDTIIAKGGKPRGTR